MTENSTPSGTIEGPKPISGPPEPPKRADRSGFAVYDNTELRFRGVVHDKESDANKALDTIQAGLRKGQVRDLVVVPV